MNQISNINNALNEELTDHQLDIYVNHLLVRGIKNEKIVKLLLEYDRERFLPSNLIGLAESDGVIYYAKDSFILDRASVGWMLNLLQDVNLDTCSVIGAKVGYLSSIVSHYFNQVIAIEKDTDLLKQAIKNFETFGLKNISTLCQPYDNVSLPQEQDVIFIEGAFEDINPVWLLNLKKNGCIIGYQRIRNISKLVKVIKLNQQDVNIIEGIANAVPLLNGLNNKEKFVF